MPLWTVLWSFECVFFLILSQQVQPFFWVPAGRKEGLRGSEPWRVACRRFLAFVFLVRYNITDNRTDF